MSAAEEFWAQIFERATSRRDAALWTSSEAKDRSDRNALHSALKEAGWGQDEINERDKQMAFLLSQEKFTSPGVAPWLEGQLRTIADPVKFGFNEIGYDSVNKVLLAIDPISGVSASLTNVIMTDEGILSVSSFMFRWCGLIARAYARTLLINSQYWSEASGNLEGDKTLLRSRPDVAIYWFRIFCSYAASGTHSFVPFKPSNKFELILTEQIAWAMEYYVVGHEFAHHALNHRSTDADPLIQEYEADRLAIRVCETLEFEPFPLLHNPYNYTGAGAVLMLSSLAVLQRVNDKIGQSTSPVGTHPALQSRISKIVNRNIMQPERYKMDRNFNDVVLSVSNAVSELLLEFLDKGGARFWTKVASDIRTAE